LPSIEALVAPVFFEQARSKGLRLGGRGETEGLEAEEVLARAKRRIWVVGRRCRRPDSVAAELETAGARKRLAEDQAGPVVESFESLGV
jgi:hypothetical protein